MARRTRNLRREGYVVRELLRWGLLDTRLPDTALDGCISKRRLLALQNVVNPRSLTCLTEDKSVFYAYCQGVGLPVPRTYALFDQPGWSSSGGMLAERSRWQTLFEHDLPDEFVVKPAWGVYGRSIDVVRRCNGRLVDASGTSMTGADLYQRLITNTRYRKFVIQERLRSHPDLQALSGTEYLQTVRVVTYVDRDGHAATYAARLKVIAAAGAVDNFEAGESGNIEAVVRLSDGTLGPAVALVDGYPFLSRIQAHPRTGIRFAGFRMPDWGKAMALVLRAATLLLPVRTIGWDVALPAIGPMLIEANRGWDPFNYVDNDIACGGDPAMATLLRRLEAEARDVVDQRR